MFKERLRKFLNNDFFKNLIVILILLNLLFFVFDTMESFHDLFGKFINFFEVFSIIIFTFEYFLRLLSAEKFKDIFKPLMLIDFLAIAPFYLSFCSINTIFLRIARLSRIFRMAKIGRYSQALENIISAFKSKREELVITLGTLCCSVLIVSILMYYAEHNAQPEVFSSIPKCFYFSVITFTTVGFGDITPITAMGRIICSITAILGIGVHGLFIGIIGSALMKALEIKKEYMDE